MIEPAIFALVAAMAFTGWHVIRIYMHNGVWIPMIGDRIQTSYLPGPPTIHTVTNVVEVGESKSQTGWMIYCEGLPGLDVWWVERAP